MAKRKHLRLLAGSRPLAARSPRMTREELGALSTTSKGWGLGLAMGAAASAGIWWLFFRAPAVSGGKAAGYEDTTGVDETAGSPPALPAPK